MNKSPIIAFFLAFIPGFGHLYFGKKLRGLFYSFAFFGTLFLSAFILMEFGTYNDPLGYLLLMAAAFIWGINILDMIISLLMEMNILSVQAARQTNPDTSNTANPANPQQHERFYTILLSFIPGVGHFHLGLNQRGLTFLAGFVGIGTMIFFVSIITNQGGFLVFLLALPIIWIYSLFDAIQSLNRMEQGEEVKDRTIMDDFEMHRQSGKKNTMIATILSMFPGAGHLYLGLQKRGVQLMIGFLLSIYILDVLRLSLFLFLIPVIWFFSFFDALQQVSRVNEGTAEDIPVVKHLFNHRGWIGIGLFFFGAYYLLGELILPLFANQLQYYFPAEIGFYYERYLQIGVVSLVMIGLGLKLMISSRKKSGTTSQDYRMN
ncbi:hypothetical protein [Thalassobacillus hwangdonensis]|uniref:Multi-TM2 domain-containing protein n=1 Tax=Thalassobacillus hwangdonensis TaxID=546108 RepID=A0ABW3L6U3_9BACI